MKKTVQKLAITMALTIGCIGLNLNAQIKVYSGGYSVIGATPSSAPTTAAMQVIGNSVFSANTSTIISSAFIRGLNTVSTYTTPDYTWYGNDQTGLFHPATNVVGFTIGGTEAMRITTNGLAIGSTVNTTGALAVTGGTNLLSTQIWSHYTWDGGLAIQENVDRANTKAFILFNTASSTVTPTFYILGSGDAWGKSWTSWSDKNVKENIDTLRNALTKLKQLHGVTYTIKAAASGLAVNKKEIGFIAQDVETVLPEVVNTSDQGMKGIVYGNITALLVEAIKAQQKQLDSLKQALTACCTEKTTNRMMQGSNNNIQTTGINTGIAENGAAMLYQNQPNPWSQTTVVKCYIPDASKNASLMVFDLNGSLKKSFAINDKGTVNITINGNQLVSGMYYYALLIDGQEIDTKKMILTE